MSAETHGHVPEEAQKFNTEETNSDGATESERSSSLDRLKDKARYYAKVGLIAGATMIPGLLKAERAAAADSPELAGTVKQAEFSETEAAQLKGWQAMVNEKMEAVSTEGGVDDSLLNLFQEQGWDLAAFGIQNGWNEADFLAALDSLYAGTFHAEEQQASETLEPKERESYRIMQQYVNEFIEQKDRETNGAIPSELINDFQQACWDLAGEMTADGRSLDDFQLVVDMMYQQTLGRLATQAPETKPEQPMGETAGDRRTETESIPVDISGLEELPDTTTVTPEWMWANQNKLFRQGDRVIAVAVGTSRDMQMSRDKANLEAGRIIMHALQPSGARGVRMSMTRERGSQVRQEGNRYQTVLVIETSVQAE